MTKPRVVFRHWIAEQGCDPAAYDSSENRQPAGPDDLSGQTESTEPIRAAVRSALDRLDRDERLLIEQLYFVGCTCPEIARATGRPLHRIESLHYRALRRLKADMFDFVRTRFDIESDASRPDCPICTSPHCAEIDTVISSRDRTATWRPVMRTLMSRFSLSIRSPQVLISHERYHHVLHQSNNTKES